ncbi:Spermatogenesis-associated protein 1 [Tupaia chinensis]|uniref:Spermatogenesis-associated protein 1 n=1 Tax=Tupaia chinensis TaxID=246437 RepID=L9KR06_TUPCH|nr:Spermatogenesis-associated protein 1 [Tupaia chinensis]
MFTRWKQQQRKEKLAAKKKLKKEREALGDKAPPKPVPKTIDNQRVPDETIVDPNDEEVAYDEATDEFASYFNRQTSPKILITTSDRPHGRRGKDPTEHKPEIILNNFTTRLGHSIGRMFASLFPHDPQFIGRQVATFHNQRDYIFFRFHRYIFKSEKKVGIQELGPRFTLKLRSLQKGTFDSKYGEYEWVHKALQPELYLLPIVDHLGNVYSASSTVTLDERQTNNGIAEADGTIQGPVNVALSKEEPGKDPSLLENTLKELLNKNQEEGDFNWNGKDKETNEKECVTLPDLIDFPSLPCQPVLSSGMTDLSLLQIERKKIIEQMKQVKEERTYLEGIREELIKKAEKLFEQSKLKRCYAYDGWKKKYYETKKVTASLEEVLTKLREDLELYYKKLLMQLEAREIKMRPKNLANITDSKVLTQCVSLLLE